MQAINIAAYQRLGDSYAEENGGTGDVDHNSNMGKDEYENLEGNSESDGGYMTPAESEPDRKAGATNYGYQTTDGIENAVGHDPKSCGYQSLDTLLTNGGQSYQGNGAVAIGEITRLDKPHVTDKPTESGYLRLEGYSEFCGNPEKQKLQEQTSGYSTIRSTNDSVSEKQQLFADPDALDDEFEVTRTCYVCTFRGLLKTLQIVFSLVALGCGLVPQFWVHSAAGVWFMAVNVACPVVAASVLLAQIYREMDRCCLCQRRLVQIVYLLLIPMLLSAGLFAASISSAARDQSEFDKNMIMVAAMLTLLSLFAVITDVVMHRRMWEMFRSTGANAYIHAAFMA